MNATPTHSPPAIPPAAPVSKWPKIVGIIAIIFGAGGLVGALITPASLFLTKSQMQTYSKLDVAQADIDAYLAQLTSLSYLSAAVQGALGLLLLVGGIVLLKRMKLASPLLQSWAVVKIVAGGFLLFQSGALSRTQMRLIYEATDKTLSSSGGGSAGAGPVTSSMMQFTEYAMWAGLGFGLIWLAALPVFLIAWFNRERIRDEVATW